MTTTPNEPTPEPEVVPSGDPAPIDPEVPGADPSPEQPEIQPSPDAR